MPKSRADIAELALRRLGVLAVDAPLTADMERHARLTLDAINAELAFPDELDPDALDSIPDATARPLAHLLAVDLASAYEVQPRDNRARLVLALRAMAFPDDRVAEEPTAPTDYT